ncbi:hypothetical protein BXZ70DRAFT_703667 [Cristinia sonorae]|uniref:F-box domain-containing protein n=1 Tax=Cristinia sonorae TaxID=1940300 RepID=A0A8K0UFM4_9AGAR|nr:hypothetical protein BXZ70DRAFT_703667 [Cristinia sonorae]
MPLHDIPNELLESIFLVSDLQSISRSQQVCKRFNEIVLQSIPLQYKIELAIDGFEDGPPGGLSVAERLHALRQRRAAWWTMQPTEREVLTRQDGRDFIGYAGHCIVTKNEGSLIFNQVASAFRGIPGRSWAIEGFDAGDIPALTIHVNDDLVVVLDRGEGQPYVRLLSMSTGLSHPGAAEPRIPLSAVPGFEGNEEAMGTGGGSLNVSDTHLGVQLHMHGLSIYNWKTAKLLLNITADVDLSRTVMRDRYLLLVHSEMDTAISYLTIVDLHGPYGGETVQLSDLKMVCQLELPKVTKGVPSCASIRRCHPKVIPSGARVPFHVSTDQIVKIELLYGVREAVILIPESTILRCISDVGRGGDSRIPFHQWEQKGCRVVDTSDMRFLPDVDGLTAIIVRPHDAVDTRMVHTPIQVDLFNFSPIGVRKLLCDLEAGVATPGVMHSDTSVYVCRGLGVIPEIYETTLPARRVEIPPQLLLHPTLDIDPVDVHLATDFMVLVYMVPTANFELEKELHILSF